MYDYIKGIFKGIRKDYIVIENNDIGYKIYTGGTTLSKVPQIEGKITLYIKQIVREDFLGLYGFLTEEELETFNLLLSINGVGAKAALSLLSIGSVNKLKLAIATEDEKYVVNAPGIGKKTAQRIILELRDKISKETIGEASLAKENIESISCDNSSDAKEALIALGYNDKEVNKVLNTLDISKTVEDIIKEALKSLMH